MRNALGGATTIDVGSQKKRGRIGKKRRITIRKRIAVAKEIKLRAREAEAEKEVAEKEQIVVQLQFGLVNNQSSTTTILLMIFSVKPLSCTILVVSPAGP